MVRYAPSLLFGTMKTTIGEELNLDRLREGRAKRLCTIMKKHGLAGCLLSGPGGAGYATGKWSMGVPGSDYVLFPVEHDPICWDIPGNYQQLQDVLPWSEKPENWRCARMWQTPAPGPEICREQAKPYAAEIAHELQRMGIKGEKIGFYGGFDSFAVEALKEQGVNMVDATWVLQEARTVKTEEEILCWKVAIAAADAAWYAIYQAIKPGATDREVSAAGADAGYKAGSDMPPMAGFFSGPWSFPRGIPATDRIIQVGDMIHGDLWGASFMGYQTCYYKTFIVGRYPTRKEKDWYKQVLDKQNAIIESIKPGATTADAAKHMTSASEWGYPDEYYAYSLDICHGIGLGRHEPPIVTRVWSFEHPQVFEPGMTIAVETIAGEPRVGGVRLEDQIVVTKNGAEIVGRFPRDEIMVCHPILLGGK
jgi:Xaa-Pro aminopeptidase